MQGFSVESLLTFAQKVQDAESASWAEAEALGIDVAVKRGDAIQGLRLVKQDAASVTLTYAVNASRLRVGDVVELLADKVATRMIVVGIDAAACRIHCTFAGESVRGQSLLGSRTNSNSKRRVHERWSADTDMTLRLTPVNSGDLVRACLTRLMPGAQGYSWFRYLSTANQLRDAVSVPAASSDFFVELLNQLQTQSGVKLDDGQRRAFLRCLDRPQALAVQGPPGTGKTQLLSMVAEGLVRLGARVAIVSLTHQSINHALSTLSNLFPDRQVIKLGDVLRKESLSADVGQTTALHKHHRRRRPLNASAATESVAIVGMTAMSALVHLSIRHSPLAPTVLLVDEASQLPLHIGAALGLSGAGSILCFGDDRQMPPVFPEALASDALATSTFARLRAVSPLQVLTLTTTYRLNRDLAGAIGETFYDGVLQSHALSADNRISTACAAAAKSRPCEESLAADRALVWLQSPVGEGTQVNLVEAFACADLVEACYEGGLKPESIMIATPFRLQAATIRRLLQQRLGGDAILPIVDTVERIQGLTVDLVIYSLCASDERFIAQTAEFLFSPHRLNVAVSRARGKAIVLACAKLFHVGVEGSAATHIVAWRKLLSGAHTVELA